MTDEDTSGVQILRRVHLEVLKEIQQAERLVLKTDKKDDCVKGTMSEK